MEKDYPFLYLPLRISDSASVSGSMEYGVVIDAGSSGSRVRVYTWTPRHCSEELPGNVQEIFNFKVVDKFKTKAKTHNAPVSYPAHDDVIKWKHFPCYWPFVRGIHRSPVNSPLKGQWCRTMMFSLIYAWTNGCADNRDAGDLRRHRTYHVMNTPHWNRNMHIPLPKWNIMGFVWLVYCKLGLNITHHGLMMPSASSGFGLFVKQTFQADNKDNTKDLQN